MKRDGQDNQSAKKWLPVLLGVTAAGIYHFVQGNGIFNRMRFASQHDAVSRYVETHFPGARYSAIRDTGDGWITMITPKNGDKILLYLIKTDEGVYIFREERETRGE